MTSINKGMTLKLLRNAKPISSITTDKAKADLRMLLNNSSVANGEPIIYAYIDSEDNSKRALLGVKYDVNHYQIFDGNEVSDKIKVLNDKIDNLTVNGGTYDR